MNYCKPRQASVTRYQLAKHMKWASKGLHQSQVLEGTRMHYVSRKLLAWQACLTFNRKFKLQAVLSLSDYMNSNASTQERLSVKHFPLDVINQSFKRGVKIYKLNCLISMIKRKIQQYQSILNRFVSYNRRRFTQDLRIIDRISRTKSKKKMQSTWNLHHK